MIFGRRVAFLELSTRLQKPSLIPGKRLATRIHRDRILADPSNSIAVREHHSMEGLAPQAFASNNLDRSMTERREQAFLRTIFPDSLMLIVSDGKVLVYKEDSHLRWFQPLELQNLAYEMGDKGLSRDDGTPSTSIKPLVIFRGQYP